MAKVIAVCTSEKKGTTKTQVPEIAIKEDFGVVGDAHADCQTHRQVSLLAIESIDKMRAKGFDFLKPGDFAENITTEGIELAALPIGTVLGIGKDTVMVVTQIGKECHAGCEIRQLVGDCIMPREGIFAKVKRGGRVKAGDKLTVTRSKK
jgi:MOSC domain-containing protein YiiM